MKIPPLARAMLAMAAAQWCAFAQGSFTVVVYNYAGAPRSVIECAAATARRAFLAARIQSDWMVCKANGCGQGLPSGSYMEAFVMPRLRSPLPDGAPRHPAGYAMPGGFAHPRAYAFWDAAKDVANRTQRPLYVVLASILAHETSHLLGLTHQPRGVMRANLEGPDMDDATMGRAFSSEEAGKLREAVSRLPGVRTASLTLPSHE
jgi:hypothetical protein